MLADEPHVVAAREILLKLREDERLVVFWREAEEKARAEEVIKVRHPPSCAAWPHLSCLSSSRSEGIFRLAACPDFSSSSADF